MGGVLWASWVGWTWQVGGEGRPREPLPKVANPAKDPLSTKAFGGSTNPAKDPPSTKAFGRQASAALPKNVPSPQTILAAATIAEETVITRLAFGSCAHQDKPQPIWKAILAYQPSLFLFLGDSIYGDTRDMEVLRAKYQRLAEKPGFQELRKRARILATWDDHDYGENDAGSEYPMKEQSKRIFLDFFEEPPGSARRKRPGIYEEYVFGPKGKRLQILLLDLRSFRTALRRRWVEPAMEARHEGPYSPDPRPSASMLGAEQKAWLERALSKPADLRLLASSLPLLSRGSGWETWDLFPVERDHLLRFLASRSIKNLIILSGDTHWAEFSALSRPGLPPLYDLTSSGLTEVWDGVAPNHQRVGPAYLGPNFGTVTIQWKSRPEIRLAIHKLDGKEVIQKTLVAEP